MEIKGFYFSLDALTATTILIAVTGMLISVNTTKDYSENTQEVDGLYVSAQHPYKEWNKSNKNQKKVLTEIYYRYYSGNKSDAQKLCNKYFKTEKYNLYFENRTKRVKACGNINLKQNQNLISTQVPVTNIKINKSFIGPQKAIMVAKN